MSGLPVDATQPRPPLTPLMFVSIPSQTSFDAWLRRVHPWKQGNGNRDVAQLASRRTVSLLVQLTRGESLCHSGTSHKNPPWPCVRFLATFDEVVNIDQHLALRGVFAGEQGEQTCVVRVLDLACGWQVHSQASSKPASS